MRKTTTIVAASAIAAITAPTLANGVAATDRFGYNGTIERYSSLSDAQSGTNAIDNITVGDRDLSLFMANNDPAGQTSDANIALGSWWYTTDPSGTPGFGNTRGNTGIGYMQLFDSDGTTDTNVDMGFDNYDGTNYTDFHLTVEGENTSPADSSRLSAIDNVEDGGIWHEYAIDMTATGLEGQETAPGSGVIESLNQPTGVSGSITGIFEITEQDTNNNSNPGANQGFYVVDFDLSMINWAWENRDDLVDTDIAPDGFRDSTFRGRAIPMPTPLGLASAGLIGVAGIRRRRA